MANRVMLNEPCLGYISEEERQSETARQLWIRNFLEEFSQQDLAGAQFRSEIVPALQQRATNDLREDKFLLIEASFDEWFDDVEDGAYLKELLPPNASLPLLPLEYGAVIFIIGRSKVVSGKLPMFPCHAGRRRVQVQTAKGPGDNGDMAHSPTRSGDGRIHQASIPPQ